MIHADQEIRHGSNAFGIKYDGSCLGGFTDLAVELYNAGLSKVE